ncbi:hypothetical protein AB0B89_36330 [Sphaerisporangium sp. NPDC049002]|uniref:hypothetical protein n=1 Tax=Sphaerisporangium sp. NPDC049002 TaxID=3155392 RepID=UPI0033C92021
MARQFLNGIDLANQRGINAADPSAGTDLANKQYVDNVARGLKWKDSVRAATTTSGALATAYAGGSVIDGVTLAAGDRILIKNQANGAENGIYVVNAVGAPTRAPDADTSAKVGPGMTMSVTEGTVNDDRTYILTTNAPIVLGTTVLSFTQMGGGGASYTAGAGLTESPAGTFNVAAGQGLEISAGAVRVAPAAPGSGLTGGGAAPLAVGAGTGISVAGNAVAVDTAVVSRHVAVNVGDGTATQIDVTHNLGTYDVAVEVFVSSGARETVEPDVSRPTTNTVRLAFATAPTAGQYRVVVHG